MQIEDDIESEPHNNPNPSEISTSGVKVDSSGTSNSGGNSISDNEPILDDESSPGDEATSTGGSNPKEMRDHDYNIIGCKNFMQWFCQQPCISWFNMRYIYILFQIKMDSIATFEGFLKGTIVLFQVWHLVDK